MSTTIPKPRVLAPFVWPCGGTPPSPADFLDNGDHPEENHECQDSEELNVAAQGGEDALAGRADRGGRSVFSEAWRVDAGVGVAAGCAQRAQRPPPAPLVVLDLFERSGRKAHRQVVAGDDRHHPPTGLAQAVDPVDISANLDTRRRRWRIRVGLDRALHARRGGGRLEDARREIDDDLAVVRLHPATRHLTIQHRQGRLASQWRLVSSTKVRRRRLPAIRLRGHDYAVVERRGGDPAMEERRDGESEHERDQTPTARGHAQNQAPQSARVWAIAQGNTPPVSARSPPSASPTAASSGRAARP